MGKKSTFFLILFSFLTVTVFSQSPSIYCVNAFQGSTTLQINGSQFTGATSVTITGGITVNSFTVNSSSSINAILSAPLFSNFYTVFIITPGGQASLSFSVSSPLVVPTFTPATIGPGDTLIITGGGFNSGPSNWTIYSSTCGTLGFPIFQTSNQLYFLITQGCQGAAQIFLQSQAQGNCVMNIIQLNGLTFNATPLIYSVSPLTAKTGDTITITGKYLYPLSVTPTVTFGGVAASTVIPVSNYMIKAVVGNGASGNVAVTNSYNVTGTYAGFEYLQSICPNGNISFTSNLTGSTYQWQVDAGDGFTNVLTGSNYSGVTGTTLSLINVPSSFNHYQYRCVVDGANSDTSLLKIVDIFKNTTDNNWETTTNWSCGALPDANTDVIINSGTATINSHASCRSIIENPGAAVIVSTGFTLNVTH